MVDTIERALNSFCLVSFLFGFGVLRYPFDRPRFRLSILYMLTVWSVYAYILHFMVIYYLPKGKDVFSGFTGFFMLFINLLVAMISLIIAIRKYKKFYICIKKLGLVDDTLEKLGTPKEYHNMRNSIKWTLIMWCVMICMTYIADAVWCVEDYNDIRAMVIPMVMDYSLYVNTFMDIRFMFLLRYIGTRLDKINDHIGQILETEEYGLRCTPKKSLVTRSYVRRAQNRKHVLWTAMHLHSELCRIARNLNDLFGIQMTLEMISYFVFLIGMFYMQYHMILCIQQMYGDGLDRLKFLICSDIWCTVYITRLVSLNYICENVSAKAEKTKNVIHKLTNLISKEREEICQFIMQISLQPLKFSGIGLFYFGYNFILKFFAWILTIVIFIVQMDSFSMISRLIVYDRNDTTYCDKYREAYSRKEM